MDVTSLNPSPSRPTSSQPVDGLALWDAEAGVDAPSDLAAIRHDANERWLIPFTTSMVRTVLHFLDYRSFRGFVRCAESGCLLCRLGRQQEVRDLWPVYDPLDQAVGVLPISPNIRPQALRPQLAPILRKLKEAAEPLVVAIRRLDAGRYAVNSFPLPERADDGAATIQTFLEQLEAGTIDLANVYPLLSTEVLATIPEVAAAMQVKGIQVSCS